MTWNVDIALAMSISRTEWWAQVYCMAVASGPAGPAGPVLAGPVLTAIFGTVHAQIMKFSHLRSLAITHACTMPWLQQLDGTRYPSKATSFSEL